MATESVVMAPPIKVTVGDEVYELRATLAAVQSINATLGGLRPAFQQVQDINYSAMAAIIAAGAGLKLKPSEAEALMEVVWRAPNKADIGSACVDFVVLLLNGGTPLSDDDSNSGDSEGNASP